MYNQGTGALDKPTHCTVADYRLWPDAVSTNAWSLSFMARSSSSLMAGRAKRIHLPAGVPAGTHGTLDGVTRIPLAATSSLTLPPRYRTKFVRIFASAAGIGSCFFWLATAFNAQAMLRPNTRMVWIPSSSFWTSPGTVP